MDSYGRAPRVLMIGPSLESKGGMATVELQLMDLLPRAGARVRFISTYDDGDKPKKLAIAVSAYARFCLELSQADIVHVHMASRGSYYRKRIFINTALQRGKRVIIHLHGGEFVLWYDEECDERQRREMRDLLASVDAVILLSEQWLDLLESRGFQFQRVVVMHNAVSVPAASSEPWLHEDVLFLGRLTPNKSPEVLLRASREALAAHPQARLAFGGDGFPERYRAMAQDLGIADRCQFLGWVTGEDKEHLFAHAGVYCLPSKHEGMPMSVLEAMAHGIPTIATRVGGIPQIIHDGVDGYLMDVDDETRLSELLCRLLDDPGLRRTIGSAGREKIKTDFDIDRNIERMVKLYRELMPSQEGNSDSRPAFLPVPQDFQEALSSTASEAGHAAYHILLNVLAQVLGTKQAKEFDALTHHRRLDLDHPTTLADKVSWLELNTDQAMAARCTDKWEVRGYVSEKGLSDLLIPAYGPWGRAEDIDVASLPQAFALKATHGCGMNYLVPDKSGLDVNDMLRHARKWLVEDYSKACVEPHYKLVPHRVYAEDYIGGLDKIIDYKFHCFNGEPRFVLTCSERSTGLKLNLYDLDWNPLKGIQGHMSNNKEIPRPSQLGEMTNVARTLSADFEFVRVDLYEIDGRVMFGELTFSPDGGRLDYYDDAFNLKWGQELHVAALEGSDKES